MAKVADVDSFRGRRVVSVVQWGRRISPVHTGLSMSARRRHRRRPTATSVDTAFDSGCNAAIRSDPACNAFHPDMSRSRTNLTEFKQPPPRSIKLHLKKDGRTDERPSLRWSLTLTTTAAPL